MVQKAFTEMTKLEQIEFFVQCQKILIAAHPNSPFVCRANNLKERMAHIKNFLNNYKGFVYQDEHVCALYNRVIVSDPREPERVVQRYMYQLPDPNYNAISIDFVVFDNIKNCLEFVRANNDTRLQYALFVRHNKVKCYPLVNLLSQILNAPIV
jgi:hypothetical protein